MSVACSGKTGGKCNRDVECVESMLKEKLKMNLRKAHKKNPYSSLCA